MGSTELITGSKNGSITFFLMFWDFLQDVSLNPPGHWIPSIAFLLKGGITRLPEEQENNLNSHFNPAIYLPVQVLLFSFLRIPITEKKMFKHR